MSQDQSSDARFVVFSEPVFGIRALARTLLTYSTLWPQDTPRDIDTVREIINRWAPPVENDTGAYVKAVAQTVGVGPDEPIDIADERVLGLLVRAIIRHENGRCIYSDTVIDNGVRRALV